MLINKQQLSRQSWTDISHSSQALKTRKSVVKGEGLCLPPFVSPAAHWDAEVQRATSPFLSSFSAPNICYFYFLYGFCTAWVSVAKHCFGLYHIFKKIQNIASNLLPSAVCRAEKRPVAEREQEMGWVHWVTALLRGARALWCSSMAILSKMLGPLLRSYWKQEPQKQPAESVVQTGGLISDLCHRPLPAALCHWLKTFTGPSVPLFLSACII